MLASGDTRAGLGEAGRGGKGPTVTGGRGSRGRGRGGHQTGRAEGSLGVGGVVGRNLGRGRHLLRVARPPEAVVHVRQTLADDARVGGRLRRLEVELDVDGGVAGHRHAHPRARHAAGHGSAAWVWATSSARPATASRISGLVQL